jgi:N-acetylmuramoyl-L-alanine amidase
MVLMTAGAPPPAMAASDAVLFRTAWKEFHALAKGAKGSMMRHNWQNIERKFLNIFKRNPSGGYAPKSLYYAGRVNQELGERSKLKTDYQRACEYFQRVVLRYPTHTWGDDALLRKARINLYKLHNKDQAYADLLLLVHRYPKGDMRAKADALLKKLDKGGTRQKARARPTPKKKTAKRTRPPKKDSRTGVLEHIRYQSSNDYTRVVLDLDRETRFKWQLLPPSKKAHKPRRLYIDLENARTGKDVASTVKVADGILKQIRTGKQPDNTTRVVLDFAALKDYKVFHLYAPYRVVVDIFAPSRTSALKQPLPPSRTRKNKAAKGYKPPPGSKKHMGDLVEQLGLTVDTIMIDPGHGGKDPGAKGNGLLEKNVVLKLAKIVGAKLKAKGFHVLYTRTTDKFIPLEERTAMANVRKADMFVSLHCNAIRSSKVHGLETYVLNLARTKDAVRVAARENAVSTKRISDLQVILTDLMLNSKVRESKDLAGKVQSSMLRNLRKHYSVRDRHVREAPFYVLMGAKMPAILIESGFITNRTEARRLRSDRYLNRLANGIVSGILAYKKQIERYASL